MNSENFRSTLGWGLLFSLGAACSQTPTTETVPAQSDAGAAGASQNDPGLASCREVIPLSDLLGDESLRSDGLLEDMAVYSFSQSAPNEIDPQLEELGPTVSIRTTGQWDRYGSQVEDYASDAIADLQATGTRTIHGLSTVVFRSQFESDEAFLDSVTRDASGEPVVHDYIVPGAHRGNLANPAFRDLLVAYAQVIVDAGGDGIFFDEANGGYNGSNHDGDEGFDDYHEADFRSYLCRKHPDWTPTSFAAAFGTPPDNSLDCMTCGGFSMRQYLLDSGQTPKTMTGELADAWGKVTANRVATEPDSFNEEYNIRYWGDIVGRVRAYARETHEREIYVTANGLFPFVDFQSVGMYPYNPEGTDWRGVDYVPRTTDQHLDGAASLLEPFAELRQQSVTLAGDVPVVVFVDWPTDMMEAYTRTFSLQERQDYFRLYGAEAYASGLRMAWHLKTSIESDPTATDSGMLDWFKQEAAFYRDNASLYQGAQPASNSVTTDGVQVESTLMRLSDGSHVVHLINHQYDDGLQAQSELRVTIQGLSASSGEVVSPDANASGDVTLEPSESDVTFVLPKLTSYAAIWLQ